jgi:hypothetical protein
MLQKIKNHLMILAASVFMLGAPLALAGTAGAANIQSNLCNGSNFTISSGTGGSCAKGGDISSVNKTLTKAVNIISAVVGVIAVIMIIVGGFKYITSGGDQNKIASAKSTLIYAIIGLVIVALAQIIVHFVINQAKQF